MVAAVSSICFLSNRAIPDFERLFLTPQQVDFEACGKLFGVLYKNVSGLDEFRATLDSWSGTGGIHLLEV